MIEQMVEGHEWLKANIDPSIRPSYGWSIDPFGIKILKISNFEFYLN